PPNRGERELLLRAWHRHLVAGRALPREKRFPNPLSAEDLEHLLVAPGMTPRLLLAALSRGISGEATTITPTSARSDPADGGTGKAGPAVADSLWRTEHAQVHADLEEKERSNIPFDAAELAEGLASALTFVPLLEVATRTERDRILTCVKAPGYEVTLLYLTSLHHGSVGSTLAMAAELAQSSKVVIVREKRFEFPRTWETVRERRAAFERLPNARWLWLEPGDVAWCLTLARLLSQARAKRLRVAGSDEPVSLSQVRDEIHREHSPDRWPCIASITRWLSDVPRDESSPATPRVRAARAPAEVCPSPSPPPFSPARALRGWLAMGRDLGRSTVNHYAHRLRSAIGRSDE
ncbi:MAG: hypothetical protein ACREJ3_14610, partial [Polyangiaceae bacterium]